MARQSVTGARTPVQLLEGAASRGRRVQREQPEVAAVPELHPGGPESRRRRCGQSPRGRKFRGRLFKGAR